MVMMVLEVPQNGDNGSDSKDLVIKKFQLEFLHDEHSRISYQFQQFEQARTSFQVAGVQQNSRRRICGGDCPNGDWVGHFTAVFDFNLKN